MPEGCEELLKGIMEMEPARLTAAYFRDLADTHSETAVIRACLQYVGGPEKAAGERPAADWLAKSGAYLTVLLDSDALPLADAQRAALVCRRHDPRFLSRLQQLLTEKQAPVPLILHALAVVRSFEQPGMLLPLLRTLSHHESEHVRSSAAKALCKLRPNRTLVERQLHSPDARTRANAIEGLWGVKTKEAAEVFRAAAADAHHRVAVNALVGLYYLGDETVLERLIEFSQHPSALYRMAAVWAFGRLGDQRAIPALEARSEDPRTIVRRKAAQVLAQLQAPAAA